jgi:AGZA family xanthine/uracil permease-like MFS transporter
MIRFFQLPEHGTTLRRELIGGLTTFASIAGALAVIPSILAPTGMDRPAMVTAVAVSAALMTLMFALATNYPIVLCSGAGVAAFFAGNVCGTLGIPWRAGLGLVFYGGVLYLIISATGLRRKIVDAIPSEMKVAIPCGIGLFITLIGLRSGGIIRSHPGTLVTLGDLATVPCALELAGVVFITVLLRRNVRGAILLAVLGITAAGLFVHDASGAHPLTVAPTSLVSWPASLRPIFFQLDFTYLWLHPRTGLTVVIALLFIDLFDNLGTLIGVCTQAGLLDAQGQVPKMRQAFIADACAAMIASCIGISSVTCYVESATGVEAGGRTGLTAIIAGFSLLLALFLTPVILAIPAAATAPALVIIGTLMLQGIVRVDFGDLTKAVPAFVTMIMMPFSFSIVDGIGLGLITHAGIQVAGGRALKVPVLTYVLAGLFILRYVSR